MSLLNSPTLTSAKLAANRANARLSYGPATPEGLERMRDSKIQHGFYSQATSETLRSLGEDPEDFDRLLESLRATWKPADELQGRLVQRLARALWRLERSDRVQESQAVDRVRAADREVDGLVRKACEPYEQRLSRLQLLGETVAQSDFATHWDEVDLFRAVYGEEREGVAQEILVLLARLLPETEAAQDAAGLEVETHEDGDHTGAESDQDDYDGRGHEDAGLDAGEPEAGAVEDGDDDDDSIELPDEPVAVGAERTAAHEQLKGLVNREIQAAWAAYEREREGLLRLNAQTFRDGAIPPNPEQCRVVFRMEDSSFRQVQRLTDLLLKLQKTAREAAASLLKDEGTSHDVDENKGSAILPRSL